MKNKIFKYDFLVVGGGLIGSLTALHLYKKKLKVLVIDNNLKTPLDERTLAVNANSKDFLKQLGIWNNIETKPQLIKKIFIKDFINSSPLIFSSEKETMGNVVYNKEILKIVREKLVNLKVLKIQSDIKLETLSPNKVLNIHNKNYTFKKIIISVGKKIVSNTKFKSVVFDNSVYSYVGFFKHKIDHNSIAYEIFNKEGPLAVLPSPSSNNKRCTFIYSTNNQTTYSEIQSIVKKCFSSSHGKIIFDKKIHSYPVVPHFTNYNKKFIFIGDSLKSIHPVAGQGWNLGVKDIQTLSNLIDQYPLDSKIFNSIYYSRRMIESSLYFGFTSLINFLYENHNSLNKNLVKVGYRGLQKFSLFRDLFIKQAMGRLNLIE